MFPNFRKVLPWEFKLKTLLPILAILTHLVPASAASETEVETGAANRPGDEEGTLPPSDGLAECAAILVAASGKSTNLVSRKKMQLSSRDWFAAAGLLALEEGGKVPNVEIWEKKVSDWSMRIGSVEAMVRHADWMGYCSELGSSHGLGVSHFKVESQ